MLPTWVRSNVSQSPARSDYSAPQGVAEQKSFNCCLEGWSWIIASADLELEAINSVISQEPSSPDSQSTVHFHTVLCLVRTLFFGSAQTIPVCLYLDLGAKSEAAKLGANNRSSVVAGNPKSSFEIWSENWVDADFQLWPRSPRLESSLIGSQALLLFWIYILFVFGDRLGLPPRSWKL